MIERSEREIPAEIGRGFIARSGGPTRFVTTMIRTPGLRRIVSTRAAATVGDRKNWFSR